MNNDILTFYNPLNSMPCVHTHCGIAEPAWPAAPYTLPSPALGLKHRMPFQVHCSFHHLECHLFLGCLANYFSFLEICFKNHYFVNHSDFFVPVLCHNVLYPEKHLFTHLSDLQDYQFLLSRKLSQSQLHLQPITQCLTQRNCSIKVKVCQLKLFRMN